MRNKDEEDEDKEEDASAPLASIEDVSPGDKDDEGFEDYWEDDGIYKHEDTVLYDAEDNEEEVLSRHKSELLSSKSLNSSDNEDEEDYGISAEAIKENSEGGGDRNTSAGGRSAECIRFLSKGRERKCWALWERPNHPR